MALDEIAAAYDGDDHELRDLIERASAINELQQHPGWQHLTDYLFTVTAHRQARMLRGDLASFDEYKETAGFVNGLTEATRALDRITAMIELRIAEAADARAVNTDEYDDDLPPDEGAP